MGTTGVILMQRQILSAAFHLAALNVSFTTAEVQLEVEAERCIKPGFEFTEKILREEFTKIDQPEIDDPCWVDLT